MGLLGRVGCMYQLLSSHTHPDVRDVANGCEALTRGLQHLQGGDVNKQETSVSSTTHEPNLDTMSTLFSCSSIASD
jgi:hypothetical protein